MEFQICELENVTASAAVAVAVVASAAMGD